MTSNRTEGHQPMQGMPRRDQTSSSIDSCVLDELVRMRAAPSTSRRILKYAGQRVRMLADAGCPVAIDEANILLADAITDTLIGTIFWDRRRTFCYHLCSVIRARTSNRMKRAKQRPYVSLEVPGDCGAFVVRQSIEGDRAPVRPDSLFECAQVARKLYRAIRRRTTQDAALTALLDAYADGFDKACDVMQFTGLTRPELVNARKRLDRLLGRISGELRKYGGEE